MKLYNYPDAFQALAAITAQEKHIPESAIRRDYYIVMMLKAPVDSPCGEHCVFKGAPHSASVIPVL